MGVNLMGSHPVNLAARLLLEVSALLGMGYWGGVQHKGLLGYGLAVGAPLWGAVILGTFTVPHDPNRSGKAPVPVPGILRLVIKLGIFAFACLALYDAGHTLASSILGVVVVAHYAASYDRQVWLVRQ